MSQVPCFWLQGRCVNPMLLAAGSLRELLDNPEVKQLYDNLVATGVMSDTEFWAQRKVTQFLALSQLTAPQPACITNTTEGEPDLREDASASLITLHRPTLVPYTPRR